VVGSSRYIGSAHGAPITVKGHTDWHTSCTAAESFLCAANNLKLHDAVSTANSTDSSPVLISGHQALQLILCALKQPIEQFVPDIPENLHGWTNGQMSTLGWVRSPWWAGLLVKGANYKLESV
jgi:hypothetical protein